MGAQAEAAGLVPIILGDMNMGAWEVVLRLRRRVDVRFLTPFGHSAGPDVSKPNYDFILGQGVFMTAHTSPKWSKACCARTTNHA